ncbi:unnamed protein product [Auanema sp. JU1783]|nr:unnamed protein product [Auanema sp. JU1783]
MMRRGIDPYRAPPPGLGLGPTSSVGGGGGAGYYYSSRVGSQSAAPSPSHSYTSSHRSQNHLPIHTLPDMTHQRTATARRGVEHSIDEMTPSYYVEHLATFAVGRQFGLTFPADGIRKLKQMEKNSAIWAQPLILRFRAHMVTVEDENGDLVEQFPLELIEQPTAHLSNDSREQYNNMLLFIVREDPRNKRNTTPTEMHIFQCNRVAATEVADDLQAYIKGQVRKVKNGRRSSASHLAQQQYYSPQNSAPYQADDVSVSSDSSELFERDVNTLNRCFDDIERFVARIQSAALAQRELEQQAHRYRTAPRRDKKNTHPDPNGILQMRAQLPLESEFVDVLRKFKLSFNLLAKLKSHIHDPNAPELLHFLFTPLTVILQACHWGLGRNIALQITSPLLSLEARELLQNCLTSKESDVWMSLGEAWRTPPEDWNGPLPPSYRPVFSDGFAPYGLPDQTRPNYPAPIHRGESAPPAQFRGRDRSVDTAPNTPMSSRPRAPRPQRNLSVDNLNLDRMSLERERMELERAEMNERERRLLEQERKIRDERARMEAERILIQKEKINPIHNGPAITVRPNYDAPPSAATTGLAVRPTPFNQARPILPDPEIISPRQKDFIDDVISRNAKLVVATFDRIAQNAKELTVSRGEYLEVLEDTKNWWECRNVHQRVGYVPHTILSMVPMDYGDNRDIYGDPQIASRRSNGHLPSSSMQHSPKQVLPHAPPRNIPPPIVQSPVEPPPAPPTPSMLQMLKEQQLKKTEKPAEPVRQKEVIKVSTRSPEEVQLVKELNSTIGKDTGEFLRKKVRERNEQQSAVVIKNDTTADEVSEWLQQKGFSARVIELFEGQTGATLFALNKNHLIQACGKDEGSRLYSQILVQKHRSNYKTKRGAELAAYLKVRRNRTEDSEKADSYDSD